MPTPPRKLAKPQKSPTATKRVRQPTTARPSKKPQRKLAIRPTDSAKQNSPFPAPLASFRFTHCHPRLACLHYEWMRERNRRPERDARLA